MHTAMVLHFAFVTPHRQLEDVHHQRAMGKKRPAARAVLALRTTNRYAWHDDLNLSTNLEAALFSMNMILILNKLWDLYVGFS